jgi:hypothetical protein
VMQACLSIRCKSGGGAQSGAAAQNGFAATVWAAERGSYHTLLESWVQVSWRYDASFAVPVIMCGIKSGATYVYMYLLTQLYDVKNVRLALLIESPSTGLRCAPAHTRRLWR